MGKLCPSNSSIYHCPQKGNNGAHPGGYDVCAQCLDFQMQRFIGQQPMPQYPKLNEVVKPVVADPVVPNPVVPAPDVPAPVVPHVVHIDPILISGNDEVVVSEQFLYQEQLQQLKAMGFAEDERIKEELVNQKGNVQRVANRLLQQWVLGKGGV